MPDLDHALKVYVQHYVVAKAHWKAAIEKNLGKFERKRLENDARKEWNRLVNAYHLARRFYPGSIGENVYAYFPAGSNEKPPKGVKIKEKLLPLLRKDDRQAP